MTSKYRIGGCLTVNQLDFLLALELNQFKPSTLKELGAVKHSHHYSTVFSLLKRKLIQKHSAPEMETPFHQYSITDEGRAQLEATKLLLDVIPSSVMGPSSVRSRLLAVQTQFKGNVPP